MSLFILAVFINYFSAKSIYSFFLIIFFLMFINSLESNSISSALLSLTGLILTYAITLMSADLFFIAITLATIYAGAILVLILFILILINQKSFDVVKYENSQIKFNFINSIILIFIFLKVNNFISKQICDLTEYVNNNIFDFYIFSKSEIFFLAKSIFEYNSIIIYVLGVFISVCSIILLALIRKLY